MQTSVITLLAAICGGLISSLVSPFVKWDIEKRKERRIKRIEKIKFWRSEIDQHNDFSTFLHTQTFNELRPLFTSREQKGWDATWKRVYLGKEEPCDRLKALQFHAKVQS